MKWLNAARVLLALSPAFPAAHLSAYAQDESSTNAQNQSKPAAVEGSVPAVSSPIPAENRKLAPTNLANEVDAPAPRPLSRERIPTGVLPMARAVQLAVQQHPSITDAVATLAQQTAGVDYAKAGYYPQIRVGMGTGTSNSASTGGSSVLASASASQMLYDFGKVDNQVSRSQAMVRRQQATVLKQIDVISRSTAEAVLMVHKYQSLTDIAQGQVDAVDKVLELSELRANAGLSTKADPIQARARVQGARAYLGQMSSELAQWRQKLRTFVGEVGARQVEVLPGLEHETLWMSGTPEFQLLPEVLIVQAERQAAKAQLATTRASKWPTISLDATGNKALRGVNPSTYEKRGIYHSIQVNVSVPLYQGGAADAQISAAAAEEAATRERIETALLQAGDQSRAWRELAVGAQGRLADVEHRRQSILSVRDLYREQYQLGTRSILDLLNAEQEIHQAEAEAQGLLHDLWQYRLEYVSATGRLREFFGLNNKVVQGMELLP
ncbi:TolC family outer membrane protein [Diaphorobacter sp. HDW4B]|uniref:TolC family outer membrane protein n=1 Tax=Diaphorobacter sp. HDW4B TaxID=2714925 RepID=UPI0014091142|nr:TolC family outer membrane protein [Diaphorobacter sp. HDW4B]QIL70156.1 TolC family outer membrane protein [Diaphorobacter sp. HDW4B]